MPSCNTLEALRRSKRESRRERRERSSHNGQRHERMGATVRHHYYQQMESKEWWNSTASATLQHGRRCSAASFRVCVMLVVIAPHDVRSLRSRSNQPPAVAANPPLLCRHEHDGKRHVRYLPFISKQQTCHQRNCLSFPCSSICRRS